MKKFILGVLVVLFAGCSSMNLEDVKAHAPDVWKKQGFNIVAYEGYQWGQGGPFGYGGAKVWRRCGIAWNEKGFCMRGFSKNGGTSITFTILPR